jgi:hypothetical protein
MGDFFVSVISETARVFYEGSFYILLGFAIAGLLHEFLPTQWISRMLGRESPRSVLMAALFGAPIPLCSCGVLPAAAELRRKGAGRSPTTAFLISTPETGVDSIALTYGLFGGVMALVRPVAAAPDRPALGRGGGPSLAGRVGAWWPGPCAANRRAARTCGADQDGRELDDSLSQPPRRAPSSPAGAQLRRPHRELDLSQPRRRTARLPQLAPPGLEAGAGAFEGEPSRGRRPEGAASQLHHGRPGLRPQSEAGRGGARPRHEPHGGEQLRLVPRPEDLAGGRGDRTTACDLRLGHRRGAIHRGTPWAPTACQRCGRR